MPGILRFLGLFNAAVWVGGSVFFSFLAGPVFFSPEVKSITPPPYNGIVAQAMLGRYFTLHLLCGGLAILHLYSSGYTAGVDSRGGPLRSSGCCLASH